MTLPQASPGAQTGIPRGWREFPCFGHFFFKQPKKPERLPTQSWGGTPGQSKASESRSDEVSLSLSAFGFPNVTVGG